MENEIVKEIVKEIMKEDYIVLNCLKNICNYYSVSTEYIDKFRRNLGETNL